MSIKQTIVCDHCKRAIRKPETKGIHLDIGTAALSERNGAPGRPVMMRLSGGMVGGVVGDYHRKCIRENPVLLAVLEQVEAREAEARERAEKQARAHEERQEQGRRSATEALEAVTRERQEGRKFVGDATRKAREAFIKDGGWAQYGEEPGGTAYELLLDAHMLAVDALRVDTPAWPDPED